MTDHNNNITFLHRHRSHHHGILSANTTSRMESSANGMWQISPFLSSSFFHQLFVDPFFVSFFLTSFCQQFCHKININALLYCIVVDIYLFRNDTFCFSCGGINGCPLHLDHLRLDPGEIDLVIISFLEIVKVLATLRSFCLLIFLLFFLSLLIFSSSSNS